MVGTKRGIRTATVVAVVLSLSAALASDDTDEPLFVYQNGRRIPTVIVPPEKDPRSQPGRPLLRVDAPWAEAAALGSPQAVKPPQDDLQSSATGGRPEMFPPNAEDDSVGPRYAGHPISFARRHRYQRGYHLYEPYGVHQALEEAYYAGRRDERYYALRDFNYRDMAYRTQRLLTAHERALRHGQQRLREGEYARAVIALTLAADLDNGDPAARIHLAQCRMAQGHYDEAGKTLRRALQLQPKLIYAQLHLETYYPDARELARHVEKLAAHVRQRPASSNVYFLLGYMEYQRGNYDAAHAAFRPIQPKMPKDPLLRIALDITRPSAE